MRLKATIAAQKNIHAAYPLYFRRESLRKPINVQVASPKALAEWAEKKLKLLVPFSNTLRPFDNMKVSLSGLIRPTSSLMKFENWSQNPKVSNAAPMNMSPFFHPSLHIKHPTIRKYIGIQVGMSEKNCQMTSVTGVLQLLISSVMSWSV